MGGLRDRDSARKDPADGLARELAPQDYIVAKPNVDFIPNLYRLQPMTA